MFNLTFIAKCNSHEIAMASSVSLNANASVPQQWREAFPVKTHNKVQYEVLSSFKLKCFTVIRHSDSNTSYI